MYPNSSVTLQIFQVVKYDNYKRVKNTSCRREGDAVLSTNNEFFICICIAERKSLFSESFVDPDENLTISSLEIPLAAWSLLLSQKQEFLNNHLPRVPITPNQQGSFEMREQVLSSVGAQDTTRGDTNYPIYIDFKIMLLRKIFSSKSCFLEMQLKCKYCAFYGVGLVKTIFFVCNFFFKICFLKIVLASESCFLKLCFSVKPYAS